MTEAIAVLLSALALAATHVFAGRLRFLDVVPRSFWLSFAGGVSVAYVFAHLLPEVAKGSEELGDEAGVLSLENSVWLLVLTGLALFYAVEHYALASRRSREEEGSETTPAAFWVSIVTFAAYNTLIGYLLRDRADAGTAALVIFTAAIALHFLVNDVGLRSHHQHRYHSVGRWLIAAAILVGATAGLLVEIQEAPLIAVLALLSGGIVLNVLKEELPSERRASLSAFVVGVAGYAALISVAQ